MKTKKPSADIHKLIRSLNKTEAGYFVSNINRSRIKEADGYVQLFKLIRAQETYNETELKKDLNYPTLVSRFASNKNILSELVIDSLVSFGCGTYSASRLHRMCEAIHFLREKQLYAPALKIVDKARVLAIKYENLTALLDINNLHRMLLKNSSEASLTQLLEENYLERKEILLKIENAGQIGYLGDKIYALYRSIKCVKNPEEEADLNKLIKDPLLSNVNNALTFNGKLKFYSCYALANQLRGNFADALPIRKKAIELWDQYPHLKPESALRYRSDLSNYINNSVSASVQINIDDIIKRIESVSDGTKENNASVFSEVYFQKQFYLLNKGQLRDALELIPAIEEGLRKFGNSIYPPRRLSFLYNIAITYFMNEKYEEALPVFERISNTNRKQEVRTDLRDISCIFKLILLYQTGKLELLDYELRNTRQRLKKNNKLFALEKTVLKYIPLLAHTANKPKENAKNSTAFLAKLETMFALPANKNLLGLEECIVWLRKK